MISSGLAAVSLETRPARGEAEVYPCERAGALRNLGRRETVREPTRAATVPTFCTLPYYACRPLPSLRSLSPPACAPPPSFDPDRDRPFASPGTQRPVAHPAGAEPAAHSTRPLGLPLRDSAAAGARAPRPHGAARGGSAPAALAPRPAGAGARG